MPGTGHTHRLHGQNIPSRVHEHTEAHRRRPKTNSTAPDAHRSVHRRQIVGRQPRPSPDSSTSFVAEQRLQQVALPPHRSNVSQT